MDRLKPNIDKGVPAKVDPKFDKWLDEVSIERIKRDLEREKISKRELTRMIMNTENLKKIEEELTSKPRKHE